MDWIDIILTATPDLGPEMGGVGLAVVAFISIFFLDEFLFGRKR